jgi:GT2 family glycosyltransferase
VQLVTCRIETGPIKVRDSCSCQIAVRDCGRHWGEQHRGEMRRGLLDSTVEMMGEQRGAEAAARGPHPASRSDEDPQLRERPVADNGMSVEQPSAPLDRDREAASPSFHLDSLYTAEQGDEVLLLLTGWIDDRSSPLAGIRIASDDWLEWLGLDQVERLRRSDVDISLGAMGEQLFGMWSVAAAGPLGGDLLSVELLLQDGTRCATVIAPTRCSQRELEDELARLVDDPNSSAFRRLPLDRGVMQRIVGRELLDEVRSAPEVGSAPEVRSAPEVSRSAAESRSAPRSWVDSVTVADCGGIFLVFLIGWVDDRLAPLHQLRVLGNGWVGLLPRDQLGRCRRDDVPSLTSADQPLLGFWGLGFYDPGTLDGGVRSVEIVLADGSCRSFEVAARTCAEFDLRKQVADYLDSLGSSDRRLPAEPTAIQRAIGRWDAYEAATMPRAEMESVVVGTDGGVFICGWIDDTFDQLDGVRVSGSGWIVTFPGAGLARSCRPDVQKALGTSRASCFGCCGFMGDSVHAVPGSRCTVEWLMKSGARRRIEVPVRVLDSGDLMALVLGHLGACRFPGNPQIEAMACVAESIGRHIVDLNLRVTGMIKSRPHVERFGVRRHIRKGAVIVCLYGRPEYLFLQNAAFSAGPGIRDYELVYVCNSPDMAEGLLREAHIATMAYGLDVTLILLPGNAGFSAANNVGVDLAQADRLIMVNPDVFPLDRDWATKHTEIIEQKPAEQTQVFGVPLYYSDGSLMHAGMYFDVDIGLSLDHTAFKRRTLLRVEHYGKGAPPRDKKLLTPRPVPAVTGAFMSCRRQWFEAIGGLDEGYVMGHYEDADFCLKSLARGVAPWLHDVRLWHLEGSGSIHRPAREGATTINRWLFTSRWASTIVPDMLGPSPRHALLSGLGDLTL